VYIYSNINHMQHKLLSLHFILHQLR